MDQETLRQALLRLQGEHRTLDEEIARLAATAAVSQIELQRLKKRKLWLKDQIARLQSRLVPDIIA